MNNSEFKVPENYFHEKKVALKQIPSKRKNLFQLHPWGSGLSIAASICLLITLSLYYLKPQPTNPTSLAQVSAAAIDEFISYSPYSAYPETYFLEVESIDLEEANTVEVFDEEQIDEYLNEYTNEFL